ncbi:MAG: SDR family NAD(P)-dependent oxidoreductase [Bacteroidales bacterium]
MKKTIMITGATSGIGHSAARKFALNGFDVIITGRRADRLNELENELSSLGARILSMNFDVRNRSEVDKAIGEIPSGWKEIDILVNNAGLASGLGHIDEGDIADWEIMIDTNLKGLLYVTRQIAPVMVARGRGHIINISSIAGKEVYENGNVYCATKHAVDSLSKAMRIDLLGHGIKVTNIAPGMVRTEFSEVRFHGDTEKADSVYRGITPLTGDDIAEAIYYCATLPGHVCINDLVITPTQQADANHNIKMILK